jgi:hypothetical protein
MKVNVAVTEELEEANWVATEERPIFKVSTVLLGAKK